MEKTIVTSPQDEYLTGIETDDLLRSVAKGYSNYFAFSNSTNEQAKNIDDTMEYMLARIDEFGAFIETIKSDTDKTEKKLIPLLYEKSQQVQQLFPLIDNLTGLMADINKNISILEDRVNQADKHVSNLTGTSNPFKWVLSHLQKEDDVLQQIKNAQALENNSNQPKFTPLKSHNTTEFFKNLRDEMQKVYSNTEKDSSTTNTTTATTTTSESTNNTTSEEKEKEKEKDKQEEEKEEKEEKEKETDNSGAK
ncbi:hypothetical protein CYY_000048 [Polysphondylium violaceum]|uniref:Uncharacterized protein n=1 Tax=Polysphondylium violaceum TaxID=133409 RepID=A0A8J4V9E7_9MYCE|nr:hypothetical protein CYY_000048 [Polysphondylium violaceum]